MPKPVTFVSVLAKHNFVKLNKEEAKESRAHYQHRSQHEMEETYALTLNLNGDKWRFYDDRGDLWDEGVGVKSLKRCLESFTFDEEE